MMMGTTGRAARIQGRLRVILVNLVVFAVLAELAGLMISHIDFGGLYYLQPRATPRLVRSESDRLLTADVLHPYFGPMHKVGVRPGTNNVGFESPQSFPFQKSSDRQFVIGIFGGSVGEYFCRRGVGPMTARLKTTRYFSDKDIVPLCFSHEGFKQPQQLLVLAYFLTIGQRFDLVLNIDGFNEVALGSVNNDRRRDISMPSAFHIDELINLIDRSTLTPEQLLLMADITRERQALNALAARLGTSPSAAVDALRRGYYKFRWRQYNDDRARLATLPPAPSTRTSIVQLTPPLRPRAGETLYQDIAGQWMEASRLMHEMLAARSVPYIHVLQPNQYWTRRRFTAAEDKIAHNAGSPFRKPVELGYPVLAQAAAAHGLGKRERFFNAIDIFDREPAQVYEDDCCHYTVRGNEVLAQFIAARVVETSGPWRDQPR